ncbi:MAG TPA: SGNH/GDSL hydrolase family protein [Polyangia bacterium]
MRFAAIVVATVLAACSSSGQAPVSYPDAAGTGGAAGSSTGGQPGSGGASGTGGMAGSGGSTSGGSTSGGSTSAGGALGSGGVKSTGGTAATGGSSATGGSTPTGGSSYTGGAVGTGGGTGGAGGTGGGSDAGIDVRDSGGSDMARDSMVIDTRLAVLDAPAADTMTSTATSLSVYVAGDSTVSTYTNSSIHQGGWGQFLQDDFVANAKVVNKAVGGMTARHFIEAGYLDQILAVIKAGDYLLVQFGTNDSNTTATYTLSGSTTAIPYYLDAQTDFKTYLTKYVDATKAKGVTTIFVTPPPRHSCNAGETGVRNGLSAYATAMKELGPTLATPVVDLNAMTIAYLANVTCETSGSSFYLVKADGTTDGTHFQETGAKVMAGLVAKGTTGISTLSLPLSAYVK